MEETKVVHTQNAARTEVISQEAVKATVQWVPKIGLAFVVFLGFWIAAALVARLIRRLTHRANENRKVVFHLLAQASKITLIAFGLATALGTVGVNVSALVAGLGLTGFALGFALRDMLSNVISGTFILLFQPFQIKDHILVSGFEGTVVNIELRYTILSHEGKFILIPNSNIFTNPVVITAAKTPDVAIPTRFLPD